jgi:hypothetical protein
LEIDAGGEQCRLYRSLHWGDERAGVEHGNDFGVNARQRAGRDPRT